MKQVCFLLLFLCCFIVKAQNFDKYKYIVVPKTFSIFNEPDKYRTSALTKFLFNKKGYTVVYDDNLPEDLKVNACLGLRSDLRKESNMFTTKIRIVLLDCNTKEVFVSDQGKSKEKEFVKSYSHAIREAFKSFDGINYSYKPNKKSEKENQTLVVNFKDDVKEISGMVKPNHQGKIVEKEKEIPAQIPVVQKTDNSTLYAQEIPNGFQLVDSTPKILYKIYKTSSQGYFIASKENLNGVVLNKGQKWFFEYYENDRLKSEELKIKF